MSCFPRFFFALVFFLVFLSPFPRTRDFRHHRARFLSHRLRPIATTLRVGGGDDDFVRHPAKDNPKKFHVGQKIVKKKIKNIIVELKKKTTKFQ